MSRSGFLGSVVIFCATVLICFLFFVVGSAQAAWRQHQGPIVTATQAWEGQTVQEPTVLRVGRLYRMWYTGGWWDAALGTATSKDGVRWTKHRGPVLGRGAGGEPGLAAHSSILSHGGNLYAYYSPDSILHRDPTLDVAVSSNGVHFRKLGVVLHVADGEQSFGNSSVWVEHGHWRMMFETLEADGLWRSHLAYRTSTGWVRELEPLQGLSVGGMFGGGVVDRLSKGYRLWYHASKDGQNLPTDIYEATSRDAFHWHARPVLWRTQPWQFDQVADPFVVGRLMFFDGMDNVSERGAIGVATDTRLGAVRKALSAVLTPRKG